MCFARRPAVPVLCVALFVLVAEGATAQDFWLPADVDSLQAVARADSNDPVAHYLVGLARWNQRRFDRAAAAFREALAVDPRYAPAHLGLAVLALDMHPDLRPPPPGKKARKVRPEVAEAGRRAQASYRMAFLLDPLVDLSAPDTPRDTAFTPWGFGSPDTRLSAMAAFSSYFRGNYQGAFALCDWIIQQHESYQVAGPIPSVVLWLHALSGARLQRFEPGIRALVLLVERSQREEAADSAHPLTFLATNDLRYMLADFRSRAGHGWSAVQMFREVLVYDLGAWMARVRLANLHEAEGRLEDALSERREAIALNPADPMLQMDLGLTLARAGLVDAADSALSEAELALPRYPLLAYYRGDLAWVKGDRVAAWRAYERFLSLAPRRLAREVAEATSRLEFLR